MEVPVIYPCCCGIDVHKKMIVACVIIIRGQETCRDIRTFGTTWSELCRLVQWLQEVGCTQVAMESMGVYWHPVFNALEAHFPVMIVNAQHLKNVPGHKTDIQDAQWIAYCLQLGLLRPSFIPSRPQRELRELTRGRKPLIEDQARTTNRIEKALEGTNSKITSVISDIMGLSGRKMLRALIDGEQDLQKIALMALGKLRKKEEQLIEALAGNFTDHHRFLLRQLLQQWEEQEAQGVAKSKGTYLPALYERYKARMGHKQAIMAIAHHLAIIIYHMIKKQEAYQEEGLEETDECLQEMRKRRAMQQLKDLGYDVSLQPAQSA